MQRQRNNLILYAIVLILILSSCDKNRVYDTNIAIEGATWNKDNPVKFEAHIDQTKVSHNVFINVRNTNSYSFRNLYLFITITSPTGNMVKDTFECLLADERGKWYGKGIGDLFSFQVPFKQNIFFPDTGIYTFEYEQAMRVNDLDGISDIGLRIETVE